MRKTVAIGCAVLFGALLCASPKLHAQFPQPPSIGVEPPQPQLPPRDISAEVARMTKRYGLSDDKAKTVHAILEEQARKADDVAKDDSLSPEQKLPKMLAIKDEEIKRVSEVLTPEQRTKYLADVRPAPPQPMSSPDSAPASPSSNKQ